VLTVALGALLVVQGPHPAARAAAPGAEEEPAVRVYVGGIEGAPRSARIGIVAGAADFVVYVCSQDDDFNKSLSHWLKGQVESNKFNGEGGGVKVRGERQGDRVEGTLTADGKTFKFRAAAVEAGGPAGLYRAEDTVEGQSHVLGWVIDAEGSVIGSARNSATGD